MTKRTAVIGAGLAGLACARVMRRAGCYVEVFEADRIIGGRMATTRAGMTSFDHGAQYVTARSTQFQSYLSEMLGTGYATRWKPRTSNTEQNGGQLLPWYVGTPGMSALVRPLAEGVRIHTGRRVHTPSSGRIRAGSFGSRTRATSDHSPPSPSRRLLHSRRCCSGRPRIWRTS